MFDSFYLRGSKRHTNRFFTFLIVLSFLYTNPYLSQSVNAQQTTSKPTINVKDYGAKGNGIDEDTVAIEKAQNAVPSTGGVLYFPAGVYAVSDQAIVLKKSNITLLGDEASRSILKRVRTVGAIVSSSPEFLIENITINSLGFDWAAPGSGSVMIILNGASVKGDTKITRSRFINPPNYSIQLRKMSNVTVIDTVFRSPGTGKGRGLWIEGGSKIKILGCKFYFLEDGIIVSQAPDGTELELLQVSNNYFDFGWWYLKDIFRGQGNSVTYTAATSTTPATVRDTTANFTGLYNNYPVNKSFIAHNIRAMHVKQSGKARFDRTTMYDFNSKFFTNKVRKFDMVRTDTKFGIVDYVGSETALKVEEWRNLSDYSLTTPPTVETDFKIYGIYIGEVTCVPSSDGACPSSDTLTLTKKGWWDLTGKRVTPPNGTRYEVMNRRPNYAMNLGAANNSIVSFNTFKRGWSDQASVQGGNKVEVVKNYIEGGQDVGITIEHGNKNWVAQNKVVYQGVGGIFISDNDSIIEDNIVFDTQLRYLFYDPVLPVGDIFIINGDRNILKNNQCSRIGSANSHNGIMITGMNYLSHSDNIADGNQLINNICSNHLASDIKLATIGNGKVTNTLICNKSGKVVEIGQVINTKKKC